LAYREIKSLPAAKSGGGGKEQKREEARPKAGEEREVQAGWNKREKSSQGKNSQRKAKKA